MDKMKKLALFFVLSAFLFSLGGCETLKGTREGAKKDWDTLKKADEQMRQILW